MASPIFLPTLSWVSGYKYFIILGVERREWKFPGWPMSAMWLWHNVTFMSRLQLLPRSMCAVLAMFRLLLAKKRHWAEPRRDEGTSRERERVSTREPESKKRGTLSFACLARTSCLSLGLSRSLSCRAFWLWNNGSETEQQTRPTTASTCWSLQVAKKRVFLTSFTPAPGYLFGPGIYIHLMHARVRFAWCATFAVGCMGSSSWPCNVTLLPLPTRCYQTPHPVSPRTLERFLAR